MGNGNMASIYIDIPVNQPEHHTQSGIIALTDQEIMIYRGWRNDTVLHKIRKV